MAAGRLLGVTELLGSPESVSRAREYVRRKLGDAHPAIDDVTLLVSEVVTNAVLHSDSKNGGKVTLAIADCHDFVHVDVVDEGGECSPRLCGDLLAEGGRGLVLVDLISHQWSVREDDTGRTVWFDVKYKCGSDGTTRHGSSSPDNPHPSGGGGAGESPATEPDDSLPPGPRCRPT
ncbi:ATP-binding protein [Sphaerisporangium perillae]|uniref:ATP-binding protein n=1 Tax=Sphaerisporangium perillae TaxID=2935860 RepID=UPI00200FCDB2|nr:ATP-binding protein [Sphaerisporangium perillae]